MTATFQLRVMDEERRQVFSSEYSKRVEIGRQDRGEPGPYSSRFEVDRWRLVIASLTEDTVSRHHLSLEPLVDGRFRISNGSKAIPIRLTSGEEVRPGESRELYMPAQMMLGRKMICVGEPESVSGTLQELPEATLPPGAYVGLATRMAGMALPFAQNESGGIGMIRWLRAVMEVLQAAATSSDFFEKAAQAAAEMVGLDSASVWLLRNGEWVEEAYKSTSRPGPTPKIPASRHVLNRVLNRAKTLWDKPEEGSPTTSLVSIAAVVAAPILNREGKVIGALYGDRSNINPQSRQIGEITEVQAMLVELLAGGIAAGLERLRNEQAALAARVQFEQFFTPDLARQLERNPNLLQGRECEVSLLFCDIRGFSRISEKLGPAKTVEWINDVMGVLSDSVLEHQGVLVDYIGDELMAMWGAPSDQPDHATLACRAALDMIEKLPELSEKWEPILGEPLDLGIGINTGKARVGNTGTVRKFKYGPLGNTVNLASRVQGATKHFKTRLLITGATRAMIDVGFATRRLGKVRVVNIVEPVELFQLASCDFPDWGRLQEGYESALAHYEAKNFRLSARVLANLQVDHSSDGPSLLLLSRVVNALCEPEVFDPVWTLTTK